MLLKINGNHFPIGKIYFSKRKRTLNRTREREYLYNIILLIFKENTLIPIDLLFPSFLKHKLYDNNMLGIYIYMYVRYYVISGKRRKKQKKNLQRSSVPKRPYVLMLYFLLCNFDLSDEISKFVVIKKTLLYTEKN